MYAFGQPFPPCSGARIGDFVRISLPSLPSPPTCSTLFVQFEGDTYLLYGLGDGQLVNYRWEGRRTSLWLSNSSRSDLLLPTPPHPSWYVQRSSNPTTRHVPQAGPQRARRPKEDCVGHQAHLAARLQVGGRLAGLNCRNALQAHSQQLCWRVARLMCVTERAWLQTS